MTPPEDEDNLLGPIEYVQLPVEGPTCTGALPLICVLPVNESRAKGRRADVNRFPANYERWFARCRGLHEGATLGQNGIK
jgi:hypothetical protein